MTHTAEEKIDENIVFIVGAPRSGTTMLGNLLSADDRFSYTGEISFLWSYGHEFRSSDLVRCYSERQKTYIRKWFERFARTNEGSLCLLEKTPSNCLRLAAIRQVFPKARFIHIIRDGRDVVRSARQEHLGFSKDSLDSAEIRAMTPLRRLLAILRRKFRLQDRFRDLRSFVSLFLLVPSFFRLVLRSFSPGKRIWWGVRIPGYKDIQRDLTVDEACALQWETCVKFARYDLQGLPPTQLTELRYEDLIARPQDMLAEIYGFLGWELDAETLNRVASKVVSKPTEKTRNGSTEASNYTVLIQSTLKELGYLD